MLTTILALLLAQQPPEDPSPPAPPSVTCEGEGYDAFDFWVGEWDVYPTGSDTKVSQAVIERLYGGCAIRENWMPARGFPGGSLSSYDAETGRWHQTWVGGRGRVSFEGGAVDLGERGQGMVLVGYWPDLVGPGGDGLMRMTFSQSEDGSMRQYGEASFDHGLTWVGSFDFTYRRRSD